MGLGEFLTRLNAGLTGAKMLSNALGMTETVKPGAKSDLAGSNVSVHNVFTIKQRVDLIANLVRRGATDPEIIGGARGIVSKKCGKDWCIKERDWRGEVVALFNATRNDVRWTRDPDGVDYFSNPKWTLKMRGGDCFPKGTLLLLKGNDTIPIENVLPGMLIWGLNGWTRVTNKVFKGILSVDAIQLNNGSRVLLTPDHHVFVLECEKHPRDPEVKPCSCPTSERVEKKIRVSDLRERDVLTTPERLAFGDDKQDIDLAYLEGLYISDGWSEDNRFSISGKDGHPKEAQKKEVVAICERLGLPYRMHERYIAVNDKTITLVMQELGTKAREKRARTLNLDEGAAGALLRGIMADSGANTGTNERTFTSTSRDLALQVRLLHKMFGITCGASYIADHGGLGKHPIWRLSTRAKQPPDGKLRRLLRVKAIDRNVVALPCYDITTEDGKVYLPEADVTVSNCDECVGVLGSRLRAIGYPIELVVVETTTAPVKGEFEHIFLATGWQDDGGKWTAMFLDPSVDQPAGWRVPYEITVKERAFEV